MQLMARATALLITLFSISFVSAPAARGSDNDGGKGGSAAWQTCGGKMVFEVNDHEVLNPVKSGRWRLSGMLEIKFRGRIEPHENSVLQLFAPGVEELQGRFEQVQLPAGWRGDVKYDDQARTVTLVNLRPDRAPAFPGAEGFGKYTLGGRGGRVIEVTNLNDHGPGSFRAACEAEGPRTVVFRVSGTIPLESKFKITNPYLTIAGQTAPGDGICIKNYQVNFDTHDLIIRYLRFRPGRRRRAKSRTVSAARATTSSLTTAR